MTYNEAQLKAINKNEGNTAVIATAGSGKTAVITKRIERLITDNIVEPQHILAITFSRKARENIENRLSDACVGVNVETFHSLALKIVQSATNNKYTLWTADWEKSKVLFTICKDMRLISNDSDLKYNEIMRFIARQKNEMRSLDNLLYDIDDPYNNKDMLCIYKKYEKHKEQNNLIEFDDLLNETLAIFKTMPDVLEFYQEQYQFILVDEFQDVSLNQALLLKELSKTNNNLFVVGDGCQAIYKFRGGKSEYLLNFDSEWSNTEIINLNTNYRCSKDIVTCANELAKSMPEGENKHYVEAVANKGSSATPEIHICGDVTSEAKKVTEMIDNMIKSGTDAKDIAVLTRTNAQLANFEQALVDAKIACERFSSASFLDQTEIKLVLCYIRLAENTDDDEAFSFIYNKPLRWLDKKFYAETFETAHKRRKSLFDAMQYIDRRNWRYKGGIDELQSVINILQNKRFDSIGDMIKYLRSRLDIDNFISKGKQADDGSSIEEIENLDNFQNMCYKFKTIDDLNAYVRKLKENESSKDNHKVKLMTIHKSKGLEYPIVFISGVSNGLLPHRKAEDVDDERRLFYVGITRAMDKLIMTAPLFRNGSMLTPSCFLDDLGDTVKYMKREVDNNKKEKDKAT